VKRYLPSPAMAAACLALGVSLGGTGYAVTVLPKNSVGTAQLKNNAVIGTKVKNGSLRGVDFAVDELPAGAKGDTGERGEKGDKGDPGTARGWAFVKADSTVLRGSNVKAVRKINPGTYCVSFDGVDELRAGAVATARLSAAYVVTEPGGCSNPDGEDGIQVKTSSLKTSSPSAEDTGFTVVVP